MSLKGVSAKGGHKRWVLGRRRDCGSWPLAAILGVHLHEGAGVNLSSPQPSWPNKTDAEAAIPRGSLAKPSAAQQICSCACRSAQSLSRVPLFATPGTAARQATLSKGFSRQEYWSGLPCPPPGDRPDPGIELQSLLSPALTGGFFTTSTTWEAHKMP